MQTHESCKTEIFQNKKRGKNGMKYNRNSYSAYDLKNKMPVKCNDRTEAKKCANLALKSDPVEVINTAYRGFQNSLKKWRRKLGTHWMPGRSDSCSAFATQTKQRYGVALCCRSEITKNKKAIREQSDSETKLFC